MPTFGVNMKKRILRFLKRYLIGLVIFYFLLFFMAFIFLNKNKIDTNIEIPEISLKNQFNQYKSINDFKGKVLLIDFWFRGCKPCLEEMKFFPHLLEKYNTELAIMSISIDPEEITKQLLEIKPKPWDFIISDNPNWTFYNDSRKENSFVKSLNITKFTNECSFRC